MLGDIFGAPVAPSGPTSITFVCTGNVCRSPLAEKVLKHRLVGSGIHDLIVNSVGLHAVVGVGMDAQPADIARRSGADPEHIAEQASDATLRASTLILTMTRTQRSELAREFPFALKRVFTLAEFVRIMEETPAGASQKGRPLFETVSEAARHRSTVTLTDADDVMDPYRRSPETHERVGGQIIGLVDRLVGAIAQ